MKNGSDSGRGGRQDLSDAAGEREPGLETIQPADFEPQTGKRRSRSFRPSRAFVAAAVVLLACAPIVYFLFSARSIAVATIPLADDMSIGGGVVLPVGNRYLLLPGEYTLEAEAAGYYPLREPIQVTEEAGQAFSFDLVLLPDLFSVSTGPVGNAVLSIDGEPVGQTPLTGLEVFAGERTLQLSAPRYQDYTELLNVEGGGNTVEMRVVLLPAWSEVSFTSTPPGAVIHIDGEERGTTPATLEILRGRREIRLTLPGYKPWQSRLDVPANDALDLPPVELQVADGRLLVSTRPGNANILVDGQYVGRSELELALEPGKRYRIEAFKAGYRKAGQSVTIASGRLQTLNLDLQADLGEILVRAQPEGAVVSVNGRTVRLDEGRIRLPAVPQRITISKPGYVDYQTTLTPKPGFTQQIDVVLKTEEQAKWEAISPQITTGAGQTMKLFRSGRLTMGASRREAGRRANETFREVELTRPFYLATREVTNDEFRQFRPGHSSGRAGLHSLNGDSQPVVNVSWADAARYCNWLSEQDGLSPVYRLSGDELSAFDPAATGYRLPTEAEWALAARVTADGLLKYPWGQQFPPTGRAGNFADRSSAGMLGRTIPDYNDGFEVTAPVASFDPAGKGIFDLGGNVAEWVHDYYGQVTRASGRVEKDPMGPEEGGFHVIRGSSWRHGTVVELRLSFRDYGDEARDDVGFRIARYAD